MFSVVYSKDESASGTGAHSLVKLFVYFQVLLLTLPYFPC